TPRDPHSSPTRRSSDLASENAIDDLDAAHRADAARRALTARLDRAEFHREARLLPEIDRIVKDDDAAVADHRTERGERLVVERRVELRRMDIRAERAADLDRADRPARRRAAAEIFQQL